MGDSELRAEPCIESCPPRAPETMGVSLHPAGLRWDTVASCGHWVLSARPRRSASMEGDEFPTEATAHANRFLLDFHQTAERADYPALLIVSMFALGLVVAPVALLALTRAPGCS
jgi:hypothetical protein